MKTNFYISKEDFQKKIEHCCFGPLVKRSELKKACEDTVRYNFAALYVNSGDASYAKDVFQGTNSRVGVPIGFPTGVVSTEIKIRDGMDAIDNGALDLDCVMNIERFLEGDVNFVKEELSQWQEAMKSYNQDVATKIIIECPYLSADQVYQASKMVADIGADYVKQSTGQCPMPTYLLSQVHIMKKAVGDRIKVKASGHMITLEDALASIQYGADRIGNDQGPNWMERFDKNYWFD